MTAAYVWMTLVDADAGDVPSTGTAIEELLRDRFLGMQYTERAHGVDKCVLRLNNQDMKLHDDPLFRVGQAFEVAHGYEWQMSVPHRVTVRKARGDNPLEVVMFGELGDLDDDPVKRVWHNKTDDFIVRDVLDRRGYTGGLDIDPTKGSRESVSQRTSDARFLYKLADRNGYIIWMDADGFHFRDRDLAAIPSHRMEYGTDPLFGAVTGRPDIQTDTSRDLVKVTVWSRDPDQNKLLGAEYGPNEATDEVALGMVEEVGDPDDLSSKREKRVTKTIERNIGVATEDERVARARSIYRKRTLGRYTMEVPLQGDPTIRPRQVHEWVNLADAHSGTWWLEEVVTDIGPGYRQQGRYLRDALGKLYTASAKPVRRRPNTAAAEPGTFDPDDPNLKQRRIWLRENGQWRAGYEYVDSSGNKGGQRTLTAEERAQMTAEEQAAFEAAAGNLEGNVVI